MYAGVRKPPPLAPKPALLSYTTLKCSPPAPRKDPILSPFSQRKEKPPVAPKPLFTKPRGIVESKPTISTSTDKLPTPGTPRTVDSPKFQSETKEAERKKNHLHSISPTCGCVDDNCGCTKNLKDFKELQLNKVIGDRKKMPAYFSTLNCGRDKINTAPYKAKTQREPSFSKHNSVFNTFCLDADLNGDESGHKENERLRSSNGTFRDRTIADGLTQGILQRESTVEPNYAKVNKPITPKKPPPPPCKPNMVNTFGQEHKVGKQDIAGGQKEREVRERKKSLDITAPVSDNNQTALKGFNQQTPSSSKKFLLPGLKKQSKFSPQTKEVESDDIVRSSGMHKLEQSVDDRDDEMNTKGLEFLKPGDFAPQIKSSLFAQPFSLHLANQDKAKIPPKKPLRKKSPMLVEQAKESTQETATEKPKSSQMSYLYPYQAGALKDRGGKGVPRDVKLSENKKSSSSSSTNPETSCAKDKISSEGQGANSFRSKLDAKLALNIASKAPPTGQDVPKAPEVLDPSHRDDTDACAKTNGIPITFDFPVVGVEQSVDVEEFGPDYEPQISYDTYDDISYKTVLYDSGAHQNTAPYDKIAFYDTPGSHLDTYLGEDLIASQDRSSYQDMYPHPDTDIYDDTIPYLKEPSSHNNASSYVNPYLYDDTYLQHDRDYYQDTALYQDTEPLQDRIFYGDTTPYHKEASHGDSASYEDSYLYDDTILCGRDVYGDKLLIQDTDPYDGISTYEDPIPFHDEAHVPSYPDTEDDIDSDYEYISDYVNVPLKEEELSPQPPYMHPSESSLYDGEGIYETEDPYVSSEKNVFSLFDRSSVDEESTFQNEIFSDYEFTTNTSDDDEGDSSTSSAGKREQVEQQMEENQKKKSKIHHIAKEIATSESVFVDVLKLLDVDFRESVRRASALNGKAVIEDVILNQILYDLPQLYKLNQELLRELEERMNNWDENSQIADIFLKNGPYLKMYSTYIREFDKNVALLEVQIRKNPAFGAAVREFESSPRCANLALKHYLLKPVQRIPQYQLLLTDYLKNLTEGTDDYKKTKDALALVKDVANHANDIMKHGDNVQKMIDVQHRLSGNHEIVLPGRMFIKEGVLKKLSRKVMQPRMFFLFNDILLCTIPTQSGQYKVKQMLSLAGMKVSKPSHEGYQNELNIVSVERSFILTASSSKERDDWLNAISTAISEFTKKKVTFLSGKGPKQADSIDGAALGSKAPIWIPDLRATMCMICMSEFTVMWRRHHCRACGKVVCQACSSNKHYLRYLKKSDRVCDLCFETLQKQILQQQKSDLASTPDSRGTLAVQRKQKKTPSALKEVSANTDNYSMSGYMLRSKHKKKPWKRLWFVIKDKVLYTYAASEDVAAMESQPLLGFGLKSDSSQLQFKLYHKNTLYYIFKVDDVQTAQRWIDSFKDATIL